MCQSCRFLKRRYSTKRFAAAATACSANVHASELTTLPGIYWIVP